MDSTIVKFLRNHAVDDISMYHSHTSLQPKGKYQIGRETTEEFWKLYQDTLYNKENAILTITEKSDDYLPVLGDFDIKITDDLDIEYGEHLYTEKQVLDVIKIFQDVLRNIVEDCTDRHLLCVLLEKPMSSSYDENRDITTLSNGFHIAFPYVFLHKKDQINHLVPRIKHELKLYNVFESLGFTSSDKIFDDCHLRNPWLLYGSRKDEKKSPYLVTKIFNAEGEELSLDEAFKYYEIFDSKEELINMHILGIKYYLPRILSIVPHCRQTSEIRYGVISPLKQQINGGGQEKKKHMSVSASESLKQSAELLPMLSDRRASDRNDWMDIGWTLFSIGDGSDEAFNQWLEFSERDADKFDEGICQNEWDKMTKKEKTLGSLKFYAACDNPEEYNKWKQEKSIKHVKTILESGTTYDISITLYELFGNEFRYDIKNEQWYVFKKHKWCVNHKGADLRDRISEDIVEKVVIEGGKSVTQENNANPLDKSSQKTYADKMKQMNKLIRDLKTYTFCTNVMNQCGLTFRDEKFEEKLDQNKYLIAFNNGVYDLKSNVFRAGRPEDFLSKSMPIDYVDFDPTDKKVKEVEIFLEKIFPDKSLRNYFIDQSSDIFEGGNKKKTIFFWTGDGDNGKSVTQNIFEQMLGVYAIKFPTTLVTGKKVSNGSADPNLSRAGGGVRWAILEEPDKTEELNIGLLKMLSGDDTYNARDLFQKGKDLKEIKPMFKLVFISNGLPNVKHSDKAFWNRVRVIPFESTFVRDSDENPAPSSYDEQIRQKRFPRDENFGDKIPDLIKAFAWFLLNHRKELLQGKRKRHPDPEKVRKATALYQKQNDSYRKYIDENIIEDSKCYITSVELHNDFKLWYKEANPGSIVPTRSDVEEYFGKVWGEPLPGMKWKGYRRKTLEDEIESGEAFFIEDSDLVNYDNEKNNIPL
uniref:SF3 helicase domain-containing protein n=1 Tax=viral metagenome TaxID=1070528 RepID=A0A6C0E2P8_9ZZZZ